MRFLLNLAVTDKRSVIGSNLDRIANECGCEIDQLTPKIVKEKLWYATVPYDHRRRGTFTRGGR